MHVLKKSTPFTFCPLYVEVNVKLSIGVKCLPTQI